ncbi:MAG: fused MFS/spermidine synthase [Burkholderiales bacterium]
MKSTEQPIRGAPPASNLDAPVLLDVPNPFVTGYGRVRLLEQTDTPVAEVNKRLLEGTYRKPFIVEDGQLRYLHFSLAYVQSAMRIDEPDVLDLRYTQKMMGFLLFKPQPRHVLMLGLGGGSLAKFCYRQLPGTDITVVEIDPGVIALRQHFLVPENNRRFRVLCADGADYVPTLDEQIDVLLADAFDKFGMASSVATPGFLRHAFNSLRPNGILVMNLAGDKCRYAHLLNEALDMFDRKVLLISVFDDCNHILFAFKARHFEPDWPRLKTQARELKARHGLDFPIFRQKMARAAQLGIEGCFPSLDDS